jgi:hypothetical protein
MARYRRGEDPQRDVQDEDDALAMTTNIQPLWPINRLILVTSRG